MNELELIKLKNGHYSSRKTVNYDDPSQALKAYNATVVKFRKSGESVLITLSSLRGTNWVLDKIVRL